MLQIDRTYLPLEITMNNGDRPDFVPSELAPIEGVSMLG
jgi:hypothetical protein